MNLKCYSDWKFGAIQIDLTPLTLRISEDSAKQLMISPIFTGIIMIRPLGNGNVSYVSPARKIIVEEGREYGWWGKSRDFRTIWLC